MEKYNPVEGLTLTRDRRLMLIVFGIIFAVWGISKANPLFIAAGAAIALVSFYHKVVVVSEEGLFTTHRIFFIKKYDRWFFRDIDAVTSEGEKTPGQATLLFTKGGKSRRLVFTAADAKKVTDLARRANPGIHTGETA
ncbi:hypothetical protein LJC64_05360 [Ruminococcaceae bacterium OttesenSCG-928-A11]|nr:hypothetical protein [Ruminococcaceae bacterium OttesenSCG-928-A11]